MLVKDKDNNPTGDSIGIRIFGSTPEGYTTDLSPKRWYKQRFGKESTGTTLEVDGYPALREGRTVYVVADNYLAASGNSYPNVYVISYNDKASSETQSIFDQVLKNLKFNEIIPTPLPLPLLTNLRADLKRIHAMQELVFGLADYYQVKKQILRWTPDRTLRICRSPPGHLGSLWAVRWALPCRKIPKCCGNHRQPSAALGLTRGRAGIR